MYLLLSPLSTWLSDQIRLLLKHKVNKIVVGYHVKILKLQNVLRILEKNCKLAIWSRFVKCVLDVVGNFFFGEPLESTLVNPSLRTLF